MGASISLRADEVVRRMAGFPQVKAEIVLETIKPQNS